MTNSTASVSNLLGGSSTTGSRAGGISNR